MNSQYGFNNNIIYHPINTFNQNNYNENDLSNPFILYTYNNLNNMSNSNFQSINNRENPFFTNKKLVNLQESVNIFNSKNSKENNDKNKNNIEENKSILFFKSHNFTNDNKIIKRDEIINEDKKYYEILSNSLEDDMKCCICLNRYVEPLLCPHCHHFFCRACLYKWYDENKNSCVYCRKNVEIESFIKISAFEKIIPFLDMLKENNNNYFNNQIKNNIDKIIVLCSNKIHEKNEDENNIDNNDNDKEDKEKDKDEEKKCYEKLDDIKADYYCFDCKKPFCSDCICINDDYSNCGHRNDHFVFNIEALNEMKLFDLLYEKENNNTINELEKMNEDIKEGIDKLNRTKINTLSFIEYIKNTFIDLIEKKINDLKEIVIKNEKEINKIKNKFNDIDNFIQKLKFEQNIKCIKNVNEIQTNLNILNAFNALPIITKNIIKQNLTLKGNIQLFEILNRIIEYDTENFDSYICTFNYSCSLIVVNENFKKKNNLTNPFSVDFYDEINDNDNNNNKKENKNKIKILVKYKKNPKEIEENIFFFPIIFNNENLFTSFQEIKVKDDIFLLHQIGRNPFINEIYHIDNSQVNQNYYRAYLELDNLIIKNDNNKTNSKTEKIKICLYGLVIS